MSLAADALQPQLVRALVSLSGRAHPRYLMDAITDAPGAGYDLDFDAAAVAVELDFREATSLAAFVGGDACRFAAAAFTSTASIGTAFDQAESLAWGLVRAYYAAFYAGHSTLRLLGRSCSYLERPHVSQLQRLGNARGNPAPFEITSGLYSCRLNSAQTGFRLIQARGRVGGAHEVFWELFDQFLAETTEDVLVGHLAPGDARMVFLKLESYRRVLRRGSGASWLSAVRNEIQYRHAHGAWVPSSINKQARAMLGRLAEQWTRDPMDVDIESPPAGELGTYLAACSFTVALCKSVLSRIASRSSVGARSFARAPLQLC